MQCRDGNQAGWPCQMAAQEGLREVPGADQVTARELQAGGPAAARPGPGHPWQPRKEARSSMARGKTRGVLARETSRSQS